MRFLLFVFSFFLSTLMFGQKSFSRQDTLRGSNTKYRDFWDVQKYDIYIEPNFDKKSIKGTNTIEFVVNKDVVDPTFQIDLQQPMNYKSVFSKLNIKETKREGDFIFVSIKGQLKKGQKHELIIEYFGNPTIAKRAPWDGGWVFDKDEKGRPFMSVACQGIGSSIWLPVKDSWEDEPDLGVALNIITPKNLVGVGNGILTSKKDLENKTLYRWEVNSPINAYNIVPSIASYANFSDVYKGEEGDLKLDYWVLDYNLEKAKKHFRQVDPMLTAFEHWFSAYPFYKDSYKLVETPYLGMEHQSNVAYGNRYMNGYLGGDVSGTGFGLDWDFIIIHETGHEWFGNNITAKDVADMWIHEAFTTYSEVLYVDYTKGKNAGDAYARGLRRNILNDKPILGAFGVNNEGSGDMYSKGANMLHTIRQVVNDDEKFRQLLRGLNKDFYHKTVTGDEVKSYINKFTGRDFSKVFQQYLSTTKIPTLEYHQKGNELIYRWANAVEGFDLPIRLKNYPLEIKPTDKFQTIVLPDQKTVEFDQNYYVIYSRVTN